MLTRTFCEVGAYGLTPDQITAILKAVPCQVQYNRQRRMLVCRNFEYSRKVRDLKNAYIKANIRKEIEQG